MLPLTILQTESWFCQYKFEIKSWDEFFDINLCPHKEMVEQSQRKTLDSNYYIIESVFYDINSRDNNGGAINLEKDGAFLLVEQTLITNSNVNNKGGGIHCLDSSGCALNKVCGVKCSLLEQNNYPSCLFCFIRAKNAPESKIEIKDSTIAHCIAKYNNQEQVISLNYGHHIVRGLNSSQNKCKTKSGFGNWPSKVGDFACKILHSSIENNTAETNVVYLSHLESNENTPRYIKNSNIIRNKEETTSEETGLIHSTCKVIIESSCILFNECKYNFYQIGNHGSTISNCTIEPNKIRGNLKIQEYPEEKFVNVLWCFKTTICSAKPDVYFTPHVIDDALSYFTDICAYQAIFLIFVQ